MIDCHTHCNHSHDGKATALQMAQKAISLGLEYYAFTDHLDLDYLFLKDSYKNVPQLNIKAHCEEILALQQQFKDKIYFAVGVECSYLKPANPLYIDALSKYNFDIIVNSVHSIDGDDVYMPQCFEGKTQKEVYTKYALAVLESLDCPYPYDTVAHIGYVSRNAPFEQNYFDYYDFSDIIDEILKKIISKQKTLEVNTHAKGTKSNFLPNIDIIKRYKQLGGELITLSSDAHTPDRIGENFGATCQILQDIGYNYLVGYKQHKPVMFKI
ncbi:MAG: histidinol-phosphatase HisJ family protein [Clostridia bacterium]